MDHKKTDCNKELTKLTGIEITDGCCWTITNTIPIKSELTDLEKSYVKLFKDNKIPSVPTDKAVRFC